MGRRKLTRILLEIGINQTLRNKQGETALDIALRKNLTEIVSILQAGVPVRPPPDPSLAARHAPGRLHDSRLHLADGPRRSNNGLPSLSDCERIESADSGNNGLSGGGYGAGLAAAGKATTTKRPGRLSHPSTTFAEPPQPSNHANKGHRHNR
jgi:ankyrin repeat protein